mgnify:CR=1 FL=1
MKSSIRFIFLLSTFIILFIGLYDSIEIEASSSSSGILVEDTDVYDSNNNNILTLPKGMTINFTRHNNTEHIVYVYVSGGYKTGYIPEESVEVPFDNNQSYEGRTTSDPTPVYSSNGSVLTTLNDKKIIKYKSYSESWYQAYVYVRGGYKTGYIHKNDLENKIENAKSDQAVTINNSTNVYARNGSRLTTLNKNTVINFTDYSASWIRVTVYANGKYNEGYIQRSDIEVKLENPKSLTGVANSNPSPVYTRSGSIPVNTVINFSEFTSTYYKITVYHQGEYKTGYIRKNNVEVAVSDPSTLQGVINQDSGKFYSRNNKVISSLPRGYVIQFEEFTSNFYKAYIYANGNYRYAYLPTSHVELPVDNPKTLEGVTLKTTNFYSKNRTVLTKLPKDYIINFEEFTSNYYRAYVYTNQGYRYTYLEKNDVEVALDYESSRGIVVKGDADVHTRSNRVFNSIREGSRIIYRPFAANWLSVNVYTGGEYKKGYIKKDQVEILLSNPTKVTDVSLFDSRVFSRPSKSSSVVKNVTDTLVELERITESWFEYKESNNLVGYVHLSQISHDNLFTHTEYERNYNELVDIWLSKNPQIWDSPGWRDATRDEVIYYSNPENYKDQSSNSFYQFLVLSQPAGLEPGEINQKILNGKGSLEGTGDAFVDAANIYGVNEVYLLAHALHETGNGDSELAKGVKVNGTTVYNMYGIQAYDDCPVSCGANHAYDQGWDTPYKAIVGGAKFIAKDYVHAGQDTLYKMRWNPASPGNHQYATDVNWAIGQTSRIVNLYKLIDNYTLFFDIPVYTGAPQIDGDNFTSYPSGISGNTTGRLNFRQSPNTNGQIITTLNDGVEIEIIGEITGESVDGNSTWYKIKNNNQEGWVHSNYVKVNNLLKVVNITSNLRVREEPIDGTTISSLLNNTYVRATKDSNGNYIQEGNWYQIYIPNSTQSGWVSGDFIKEIH